MSSPIPINPTSTHNPCVERNKQISLQTKVTIVVLLILLSPIFLVASSTWLLIRSVIKTGNVLYIAGSYISTKVSSLAKRIFFHQSSPVETRSSPRPEPQIVTTPQIVPPISIEVTPSIAYLNSLLNKLELLQATPQSLGEIQIHDGCFSADIEKVIDLQQRCTEQSSQSEKEQQDLIEERLFPSLQRLYNKYIRETFCHEGEILKEELLHAGANGVRKISFYLTLVEILIDFTKFQSKPEFNSVKRGFSKIKSHLNILLRNIKKLEKRDHSFVSIDIRENLWDIEQTCAQLLFISKQEALEKLCPEFLQKLGSPRKKLALRESILKKLIVCLNQKELGHIILVGSAGSGKSALLEMLAEKLPRISGFTNCAFYKLKADSLGSDIGLSGTLAGKVQKMKTFFESLKREAKTEKIFVVIDEIHQLTGMGVTSGNKNDVWQSLKEDLGNSEYTFIGTTTTEEYNKIIAEDSAVTSRFTKLTIPELTEKEKESIISLAATESLETYELTEKSSIEQLILKAKIKLAKDECKNESDLLEKIKDLSFEIKQKEEYKENSLLEDATYKEYQKEIDILCPTTSTNIRKLIKTFNYVCSKMQLNSTDGFKDIY